MKKEYSSIRLDLFIYSAILMVYSIAYITSRENNILSTLVLLSVGVILYLFYSFRETVNLLDFKAIFSGMWMISIGLAQLQLLQYQVRWSIITWITLAVSHVVFLIANQLSAFLLDPSIKALDKGLGKNHLSRRKIIVKNERLFWISIVSSSIGLLSFIANVMIKGYIPVFSIGSSSSAYYDFYTRFQIFYVASLTSVGLSYYCIKALDLSKARRLMLWANIMLLNFILPILLVQRGTFLNSMLIFTAVVYLQGNRKLKHLLVCLVLLESIYFLDFYLRGFSNTQQAFLFQQKEITTCEEKKSTQCIDPEDIPLVGKNYVIHPSVPFLYSYLTVSHDNLTLSW